MTLFGIDVSEHQNGMNLKNAINEHSLDFAIIRTNYGTHKDFVYRSHVDDAKQTNAILAAYTYLRNPQENVPIPQQVQTSLDVMGPNHRLPIWLDCEAKEGLTQDHINQAKTCYEQAGIRVIGIYSYWPWWTERNLDATPYTHVWGAAYPRRNNGTPRELYPGDTNPQWNKPMGGIKPHLWQYSSTGRFTGFPRDVDLNAFRGTRTELNAIINGTPPTGNTTVEKILPYDRGPVPQETYYWCGPATAQTIINQHNKNLIAEQVLANEMGTTRNGTNTIDLVAQSLKKWLPDGRYATTWLPNDPATNTQKEQLWANVKNSIDAGYGVAANIVAPPSNYPKPSYTSTIAPTYAGGTVYHYIAIMGYAIDPTGTRHLWVADSGFSPYGYWCTLDQMATLIPPKGYAYATATLTKSTPQPTTTQEITNVGTIRSLINPKFAFKPFDLIAIIDATCWSLLVLAKEIARKQGIDPDKTLEEAKQKDRQR
ncbi:GH25 family lysozyme [Corynebacterium diphtheriae]|uniref:GH25 family lysozyme n=1 Tax=Corynebacterium diphtheriae TaxID=1717 RepID=UPI003359D6E1